ncbi:PIN2/TERF1-interacting telomerase inhibitor 1 [Calypte anna]|uniref:PIN2/TERF1-interacting telomerase inhibitor 1 n=1 Tax=Calypte anna TaxID=9244 RepID=UPI0011C34C4C|nr:PIN2/TERF1-interacting telomerase inhibitor 1 [Calypte anna]
MAMLAEPRRKQKWSVDPRNSAWSKDESKFGQKMLEKMGWSKGKGLGAQEQGNTEHIKVQVKNNTLGLGATINHEDNWIAHQDDFNQLLAQLNDCHGQGETESPVNNQKTFSLEEKSKSSKKRVHYMKFAKGKDLSLRSADDLSCIFGKRQKSLKAQEDMTDPESQEGKKRSPWLAEPADGYNTVKSVLTVQEYFAKRMAKLKGSQDETETKVENSCPTADEALEPSDELKTKVKKKKKKQKRDEAESAEQCEKPEVEQLKIGGLKGKGLGGPLKECCPGKKKRKHKEQPEEETNNCDENMGTGEIYMGISDGEELGVKDYEAKQKKCHKKKHKRQKEETDECIEGAQRKKKKHCKHI